MYPWDGGLLLINPVYTLYSRYLFGISYLCTTIFPMMDVFSFSVPSFFGPPGGIHKSNNNKKPT